jgi:hypothetical protein
MVLPKFRGNLRAGFSYLDIPAGNQEVTQFRRVAYLKQRPGFNQIEYYIFSSRRHTFVE